MSSDYWDLQREAKALHFEEHHDDGSECECDIDQDCDEDSAAYNFDED